MKYAEKNIENNECKKICQFSTNLTETLFIN